MGLTQKTVRLGCASAFWGDTGAAASQLVAKGELDYLVFDYLAEMTMSLMAAAQLKSVDAGFAPDFITSLIPLLPSIALQGIKVCSNAGGINPLACAQALQTQIDEQGLGLKVYVIEGDDLRSQASSLQTQGITEMFSKQALPSDLTSVNAYLGAPAIAKAFEEGADIVITGRVVDSAVVLGPLVYEFGWSWQDYDKLAQASLAGHIIECGTQCTGGNFTDWHLVKDGYSDMGFPIVECHQDGRVLVTKIAGTGGLVSCDTVGEQILYEIGDPRAYQLPDVICDFSQVTLQQEGKDRVLVTGASGRSPSAQYKVSATYLDGYRSTASFLIAGREAALKGQVVAEAIISRVNAIFRDKGVDEFTLVDIEILGAESTYGKHSRAYNSREVVVKLAVQHKDRQALFLFGQEIAQAATAMAPGITGLIGGRPKPNPRLCLFSFLIDKRSVNISYRRVGRDKEWFKGVSVASSDVSSLPELAYQILTPIEPVTEANRVSVPLIALALARSGDKGNHCNIGVIARKPEYLAYIQAALTRERLSEFFPHLLCTDSRITLYQVPGIKAINILLENSLSGGGMASLRADPQGKAIAQQLLDFPVEISNNVFKGSD